LHACSNGAKFPDNELIRFMDIITFIQIHHTIIKGFSMVISRILGIVPRDNMPRFDVVFDDEAVSITFKWVHDFL
jgi:hypothetical protein